VVPVRNSAAGAHSHTYAFDRVRQPDVDAPLARSPAAWRYFFRSYTKFHHTHYAKGHLVSAIYRGEESNNTPYFLIPTTLLGLTVFLIPPFDLFLAVALAAEASFYALVYLDRAYRVEGCWLERFDWFRPKQQLHFVHHLQLAAWSACILLLKAGIATILQCRGSPHSHPRNTRMSISCGKEGSPRCHPPVHLPTRPTRSSESPRQK
jgi:hypothetical protein